MKRRLAITLLEVLLAVSIIAVLAVVIIPRIQSTGAIAKFQSCTVNREVIEIQAALWKRSNGSWPSSDLSDIERDISFFPDGLPKCPVDGESYKIDSATGRVLGHTH